MKPAKQPDPEKVKRDHEAERLRQVAPRPDPKKVEADWEAERIRQEAEQPDPDQVEKDWEEERISRVSPQQLADDKLQEELRQHAELIAAIQAAEAEQQ